MEKWNTKQNRNNDSQQEVFRKNSGHNPINDLKMKSSFDFCHTENTYEDFLCNKLNSYAHNIIYYKVLISSKMKEKGSPVVNSKYHIKSRVVLRTGEKLENTTKTFVSNMYAQEKKAFTGTTPNIETTKPKKPLALSLRKKLSIYSPCSNRTDKFRTENMKKQTNFSKERRSLPELNPPSLKKFNNFLTPKNNPTIDIDAHPTRDFSTKASFTPTHSLISNFLQNKRSLIKSIKGNISMVKKMTKHTFIRNNSNDVKTFSKCTTEISPELSQVDSNATVVITKCAYYSKAGCIERGVTKINQDSFLINPKLGGRLQEHLFGIADGHGQFGREISVMIKRRFPELFNEYFQNNSIEVSLQKAFLAVHKETPKKVPDARLSGSTCNILYIKGRKIISANSGDSRSIVCSFTDENNVKVLALSRDHKPDDPEEARRIIAAGGRIHPFINEFGIKIGPLRVWQNHQDFPGLAMTRAIGDLAGAPAGIVPYPELRQYTLHDDDRFIVLASDGIWEYMSNKEVAQAIYPFYCKGDVEGAANAIVKEAHGRWIKENEAIDDITCVILFLALKSLPK